MGRGDHQTTSTAIIASNFLPADQGRLALLNYFSCASCHGDMQLHTQMCINVHNDTLQAATAFHVSLTIQGGCGIAEEGRELCCIPNWLRGEVLFFWCD